MPNVFFCIVNAGSNKTLALNNWTDFYDYKESKDKPKKNWRYADFINSFSMNQEKFLRSEAYISSLASKLKEIIKEKNIKLMVFEQTGMLMWSWSRYFYNSVKCILRIHDSHFDYLLSDIKTRKKLLSRLALMGSAIVQKKYEKEHIRQWNQIQFLSKKEFQFYCSELKLFLR